MFPLTKRNWLIVVVLCLCQLEPGIPRYTKHRRKAADFRNPVILVPGDGGTQIEATINKTDVVHYICERTTSDYFTLWLNMELMVPVILDCWVDNIRIVYDPVTRTSSNSPGVKTRIPGFGNTSTVEWIDPSRASQGSYFTKIVEAILPHGYERGVNVHGAPYDFRKAPNEQQAFFADLKVQIETTFSNNGNLPVILIAHSMGSPFMLYFLNHQTQPWKDRYVRALVTLSGVWGGAVKAMRVFASGDNLGIYVLSAHTLRGAQRTTPTSAFVLPSDRFWSEDEVLIYTDSKNYTVADYQEYFEDMNISYAYEMWKDSKDLIYDLTPPGVEVHCLYGVGVDTDESAVYPKNGFPEKWPQINPGDGDGTVNRRSLEGCLRWEGQQRQPVYSKAFDKIDHMNILRDPNVLDYIKNIVSQVEYNNFV